MVQVWKILQMFIWRSHPLSGEPLDIFVISLPVNCYRISGGVAADSFKCARSIEG